MQYNFIKMNQNYAEEIAYQWKYKGKYSFYDTTADKEDLAEFLDPKTWDRTFAVLNKENDLIGFYSYTFQDEIMWIGFGLKPDLTGQGLGKEFVKSGIEYGIEHFDYQKEHIMLAVAEFNKRAIKLYKNLGFKTTEKYDQPTNGGVYKFYKMKKILNFN